MNNKLLLMGFAFLFILSSVYAVDYPTPYNQYVNDYAKIFSEQENYYLQSLFYSAEQNTTAQVVVVTIDSLNGSDISQYTFGLGQKWGVGNAEKDNGMVILYSKQENKIFAATGYGLEGILPDSKIGRLLDENYVPLRNEGNVTEGIIAFSNAIYDVLIQNADEIRAGKTIPKISIITIVIFFLIVFFVIALIAYPFVSRKRKGFGDFMTFFFIDFLVRIIIASMVSRGGSGSRSGFGGGFSGGGFGGGSFGGGGAGR